MLSVEEQVVMGPHDGIINGLAAVFACYYIFNLQYPEDGACTLEFIQRYCNTDVNIVPDCLQLDICLLSMLLSWPYYFLSVVKGFQTM